MVEFNKIGFNSNLNFQKVNKEQPKKENNKEQELTKDENKQQSADDVLSFLAQSSVVNQSIIKKTKSNPYADDISKLEEQTGYNVSKYVTPEQAQRISQGVLAQFE